MLNEKISELESKLRNRLVRALRKDSSWGKLFGEFIHLIKERQLTAYLFGGTVRDLLLLNATQPPRDLDIVVDDSSFEFFLNELPLEKISRNRFGGLKCNFKTLEIDVWPLRKTWAFEKGYRQEFTFGALPTTTFLNLDAIVAEISPPKGRPRRIYESGFFVGVIEKKIDCNLELTEYPELNIVRGFVLSQRTGYHFSNRFCRFLLDLVYAKNPSDFERAQLQHYKRIRIPKKLLHENFEQIRKTLNTNPCSSFLPIFPRTTQQEFTFVPGPYCFEAMTPWMEMDFGPVNEGQAFYTSKSVRPTPIQAQKSTRERGMKIRKRSMEST
ncbi:MAG TPA: hypothetical protein VG734_24875 [Lacunisphaera sp.]|nr:hypothetical protein [Lacunisphaera sp.]